MFAHYLHPLDVKDFIPYKILELYFNVYLPPLVQNATLQPSRPSDIGAVQTWFNSNQPFSGSQFTAALSSFQGFLLRASRNLEITHFGTSGVTSLATPKKDPEMNKGISAGLLHVLVSKHTKKSTFAQTQEASHLLRWRQHQHVASKYINFIMNSFTQLEVGHGPTCCMFHIHPCPMSPPAICST